MEAKIRLDPRVPAEQDRRMLTGRGSIMSKQQPMMTNAARRVDGSITEERGLGLRIRTKVALLCALVATLTVPLVVAQPAGAVSSTDWPAFLADPAHSSTNASTAITPDTVGTLRSAWTYTPDAPTFPGQPGGGFDASPVVADGFVYIGGLNGILYALDESTGTVAWSRMLGYVPALSCYAAGITATATVAPDPTTGLPTVYAAGGSGKLYALNAASGKVLWAKNVMKSSTTENDYYQWSSPTVANGKVYIGFASMCDDPLVRGGVRAYDQASGTRLATWYGVPAGQTGATVWSSVAATAKAVYVTTGNGPLDQPSQYSDNSIVKLDPTTLKRLARWRVPASEDIADGDFGASPTLFTADGTPMVGACAKNGIFYALRADTLALVWERQVSVPTTGAIPTCSSSAVWDGSRLFVAASQTTIDGADARGSIRELNPATGTPVWETPLPGAVTGNPTLDGAGVLAVPMWDTAQGTNGVQLVDADTGTLLRLFKKWKVFAQPTFADSYLFVAGATSSLSAYSTG